MRLGEQLMLRVLRDHYKKFLAPIDAVAGLEDDLLVFHDNELEERIFVRLAFCLEEELNRSGRP